MRTRDVHFTCRAALRRWLVALPLVVLSLSANANFIARTTHGNFEIVRNGKTTELRAPQTVMGNGNAVASTGTVTQGMGATAAGSTAAAGVNLGGTASVPVNGASVPVALKTNLGTDVLIPAAMAGIGCVQGGVVGVLACAAVGGAVAAAPLAYKWVTDSGGRINPTTGQFERAAEGQCVGQTSCRQYRAYYGSSNTTVWVGTFDKACDNNMVGMKEANPANTYTRNGAWVPYPNLADGGYCPYIELRPGGGTGNGNAPTPTRVVNPTANPTWLPSTMDDIAPYMKGVPVDPGIVKELADRGIELGNPPLQVTGPSSVPGPTTSTTTNNTTNNTSSTVTTNTTNNYTYEGNKVTNIGTSISSTTTTKNPDGTTTTTGTSTTNTTPGTPAEPEEQKVQCDKYPNSLGCADLDVPAGDIPKSNKNITFSEEAVLGGGSCPADRLIGQYTFSYAPTCSTITSYVRPLVLMIAGWMAIVIIFSIGKPEA